MQAITSRSLVIAAILGLSTTANVAQAGMFDMVNPSKWFNGDHDRYYGDRYYGGGPYGYGGPYGGYGPYGYGHPGYGGYGPYGWGGGYPGYGGGYGGGYGPSTIVVNPSNQQGQQQQQHLPE